MQVYVCAFAKTCVFVQIKLKEEKYMKIAKNKTVAITIAIFLTLSMGASMILLPSTSAHTPPWQIPTFAYISVVPNPVGVNQKVDVVMWLDCTFDPIFTALGNDYRFHNYELTIIAPNGAVTTQTFAVIADSTSSQGYSYTPSQVGTYTFNFTFPGQTITTSNDAPYSPYINDVYLPSTTSTTVTVQQTPLPAPITSSPLPTAYWTPPIYGENTGWYTISSNWLGEGAPGYGGFDSPDSNQQCYPGDAVGPLTAHIMWTEPFQLGDGGVAGGNNFLIQGDTYFEGSAYNQRFANPIVLNGYIYYTETLSAANAPNCGFGNPGPYGPTDCVNLQTGQLVWSRADVPPLSFGYIYSVQQPNEKGVYPAILFTSNFGEAFDAATGDWLFNVTGVPSASAGTTAMGPNGEQLRYVFANDGTPTNPQWYLAEWNSSKLWPNISTSVAISGTIDGSSSSCYDWNVSIPWTNKMPIPMTMFGPGSPVTLTQAFCNNMLICYEGTLPNLQSLMGSPVIDEPYTYFGVNLNASRGAIGSVLWSNTVQPPPGNVSVLAGGADPTADNGQGVFFEAYRETMQFVGYSMATGHRLWGPTAPEAAFDYYGNTGVSYVQGAVAYGRLYSDGYAGILYCYNLTNGNLLWTYGNGGEGNSTNSGFYTPFGYYPTFITAIGNGVIYTVTSEHTATNPIYRGSLTRAINATTGHEIWTLSDYTSNLAGPFSCPTSYAIANGYATFFNGYDNQIYSVGRGPSQTTVQAPLTAVTEGNNVVIQGTVMDVSSGTKQTEQAADFPNGVPCASDASMTAWMGYVYQQQPEPTNFTGVTVMLTAIDPNNNFITLGKATTNAYGLYYYDWTPPSIPGNYLVTATFAGTNGYWGSSAQTDMVVQNASPTPAPTASPPTGLASTGTVEFGILAVIIVIIIIGAVIIMLMLRKRP